MLVKTLIVSLLLTLSVATFLPPPGPECKPCNIECGDHPVNQIRRDKKDCPFCECECPQIDCPIGCPNNEFSFPVDEFGCRICACKEEPKKIAPVCPWLLCFPSCLYGSIPDENGCDTCNCKPAPASASRCDEPIVSGFCWTYIPSWGFDSQFGRCTRFIYGGCGGTRNRFRSRWMCERVCATEASTTTTTTTSSAVVKSGECPASSGLVSICIFRPEINCLGDDFCPREQKCCSEGCGSVCKNPVNASVILS